MADATITVTVDKGVYSFTSTPAAIDGAVPIPAGGTVAIGAVGATTIALTAVGSQPFTTTPINATAAPTTYTLQQVGGFSLLVSAAPTGPEQKAAAKFAMDLTVSATLNVAPGAIIMLVADASAVIATKDPTGRGVDLFVGETGNSITVTSKAAPFTVGTITPPDAIVAYDLSGQSGSTQRPLRGTINVSTKKKTPSQDG
jgi:uncharacterized membrane protein